MKVVAVGKTVLFLDLVAITGSGGAREWKEVSRVEAAHEFEAQDLAEKLDEEFNPPKQVKFSDVKPVTKDAGAEKDDLRIAELMSLGYMNPEAVISKLNSGLYDHADVDKLKASEEFKAFIRREIGKREGEEA